MSEKEKLAQLMAGFSQLADEGQRHILAVSQALTFAQSVSNPTQKVGSSKDAHRNVS